MARLVGVTCCLLLTLPSMAWAYGAAGIPMEEEEAAARPTGLLQSRTPVAMLMRRLRREGGVGRLGHIRRLRRVGGEAGTEALCSLLGTARSNREREEMAWALAYRGDEKSEACLRDYVANANRVTSGIVTALGAFGTPTAFAALRDGLARPRDAAAFQAACVQAGPGMVPFLLPVARQHQPGALKALGLLGDPSAFPVIAHALGDELPATRRVALQALSDLRDPRARPLVRGLLNAEPALVATAAREAFWVLAGPEDAATIELMLLENTQEASVALRALLRVDAARGTEILVRWISGADVEKGRIAAEVALSTPQASLAPVYHGLVNEGSHRAAALSMLAELEGGAGVPVLLSLPAAADVERALAVAASRWPLSSSNMRAIRSRLRALPVGIRRTTLRALAGDRSIEEELRARLAAERVAVREWAAAAAELLGTGGPGLRRQLREAMASEQEPTAFEAMVHAAVRLGVKVPAVAIRRFLQDSRGRAAALKAIPTLGDEARGAVFRRALRAGLWESDEAVVRAAIRALATRHDTAAWPALVRRYETASESVQTLIARHAASFRGHPRFPQTRAALVRTSPSNRVAWFAEPAEGRGVLRFQVDGELTADGVFCRAILPTGEIRIRRTLPGGEVFFAHQPEGVADVLPARTDRDLR